MGSMVRMGVRHTKGDGRGMMEDVVVRLKELTDVDFECDSAKRENEFFIFALAAFSVLIHGGAQLYGVVGEHGHEQIPTKHVGRSR